MARIRAKGAKVIQEEQRGNHDIKGKHLDVVADRIK